MSDPPFSSVKVFISSPGDVGEEREIVRRTIERLARELGSQIQVDAFLWEANPLYATSDFQSQIDQALKPGESDFAVFVLWSRLGTVLPAHITRDDGSRYLSGTEYEFEDAVRAYLDRGTPRVLVYRKTATPLVEMRDPDEVEARLHQQRLLNDFFERNFSDGESVTRAFFSFQDSSDFESMVETHLRKAIVDRIGTGDGAELTRERSWEGSPFRGLETFEREHSDIFFGRTRAVSQILRLLKERAAEGHPFAMVLGMSGVGKSSLVRAGVLPFLTAPGVVEDIHSWRSCNFTPAEGAGDVLGGLARALTGPGALPELLETRTEADLVALAQDEPEALAEVVAQTLEALGGTVRCALFIDQFEELFTSAEVSQDARSAFVTALHALVTRAQVWTVCAARSDAYPRLQEIQELVDLRSKGSDFDLLPPSATELRLIIRQPARLAGLHFERRADDLDLDETLADQAVSVPEGLPLLEFTLEQLYQGRSPDGTLTFDAYEAMGGLSGSISRRAEQVATGLDIDVRETLPQVLRKLVSVDFTTGAAFRRSVPLAEMAESAEEDRLVQELIGSRLLVSRLSADGTPTVTLVHESLLRLWARVRSFIADEREFLTARAQFEQAALFWDSEGRPDGLLLQEAPVVQRAEDALSRHLGDFDPRTRDFLSRSVERQRARAAADRRAARQARLRRVATAAATVIVVMTIGVGGYLAVDSARSSSVAAENEQKRRRESMANGYALESQAYADQGEPYTALALATDAVRLFASAANAGVLRSALSEFGKRDVLRPTSTTADGDTIFGSSLIGGRAFLDQDEDVAYLAGGRHDVDGLSDVDVLTDRHLVALLGQDGLQLVGAEDGAVRAEFPAPEASRPTRVRYVAETAALLVHWGAREYAWIDVETLERQDFTWGAGLEQARALAGGARVALDGPSGIALYDPADGTLQTFVADRSAPGFLQLGDTMATPARVSLAAVDPLGPHLLLHRADVGQHELWDVESGTLLRRFRPDVPGDAWHIDDGFVIRRMDRRGLEFWPLDDLSTPAILDMPFDSAWLLGGGHALVDQQGAGFLISVDPAGRARAQLLQRSSATLAAWAGDDAFHVLDASGSYASYHFDGALRARVPLPGWHAAGGECPSDRPAGRITPLGDQLRMFRCEVAVADVGTASGEAVPIAAGAIVAGEAAPSALLADARTVLLDAADARPLRILAHEEPVRFVGADATGSVLTLDGQGTAHVWAREPVDTVEHQPFSERARLAVSGDADSVGVFSGDRLTTFSASRGAGIGNWTLGAPITSASIDPGGASAIVGLRDGRVVAVDQAGARSMFRHDGSVGFVAIAHGRVLSGSEDGVAAVVDRVTGQVENTLHHWGGVDHGVALEREGAVVTATLDGFVQFHDFARREDLTYASLGRRVLSLAADGDSAVVVTDAPAGEEVALLDPITGTRLGTLPKDLAGVSAGLVSLDRSRALLATAGGSIWVYDLLSAEVLATFRRSVAGDQTTRRIASAAVSPDAATFAFSLADGSAHAWNAQGWKELIAPPEADDGDEEEDENAAPRPVVVPPQLAFTRDGTRLVARLDGLERVWATSDLAQSDVPASAPPAARIQTLRTERRIATEVLRVSPDGTVSTVHRFDERLDAARLAPDGTQLLHRRSDGTLGLYDMATRTLALTIPLGEESGEMRLSADGRTIAVTDLAGGVRTIPVHARDLVTHAQRLQTGAFP